uniref:Prokineticin 1 n=1 Tax=Varanus komodoensis TaxID=61221 RepID=A0A8D2ISM6_VARKO
QNKLVCLPLLLLLCSSSGELPSHRGASFQACERDLQCGGGTCCAISLWLRGLRMCTPLGQEGDECHPISHKVFARRSQKTSKLASAVPFFGKRQHHTCPCLPNFICQHFTSQFLTQRTILMSEASCPLQQRK